MSDIEPRADEPEVDGEVTEDPEPLKLSEDRAQRLAATLTSVGALREFNEKSNERFGPLLANAYRGIDTRRISDIAARAVLPNFVAALNSQLSGVNLARFAGTDLGALLPSKAAYADIVAAASNPQGWVVRALSAVGTLQSSGTVAQALASASASNGAVARAAAVMGASSSTLFSQAQTVAAQLASPVFREVLAPRLSSMTILGASGVLARAAALESGFTTSRPSVAGAFGLLQDQLDATPRLAAEVGAFADAAATPSAGALPLPAKELHQRAERIEEILDEDPGLRDELAHPLADVQAVSATSEWDTISFAGLLDIRHRPGAVTGIAVACGLTVGVARFLIGAASGSSVELAIWDGAQNGAAAYVVVRGLRRARNGTRETFDPD